MEKEIRRVLSEEEKTAAHYRSDRYSVKKFTNYFDAGKQPTVDELTDYAIGITSAQHDYEQGYTECAQQSAPLSLVIELVEAITAARNRLYDNVPTGQIEAFQLITLISSHLKDVDAILTKAQPFMPKTGEDENI